MEKTILGFSVIGSLLVIFLVAPLIGFLAMADHALISRYGLDPEALNALIIGILGASLAVMILILVGIPLCYILARCDFPGKSILESILELPLAIPHGIAGLMLLSAYNPHAPLGRILQSLGMAFQDSFWGIVAAMGFVSAPIAIGVIRSGIQSVDPDLEYIARSLGASHLKAITTITLPLIRRSLGLAGALSWARSMSEVGALLILAYYPKSINVLILERFWAHGFKAAIATATPLMVICLGMLILIRKLSR